MTQFQRLVRDFNVAVQSPRSSELRASLIEEEGKETVEGIRNRDPIATLDGLCDVLYVTYGSGDCFDTVLNTPMSEMEPSIPPLGWGRIEANVPAFRRAYEKAVSTLRGMETPDDLTRLKTELETLADMCWITASQGLGVDLRPFFVEVHNTNMHKTTGPIREDGKRLKPPGWKPPRIAEMYAALKRQQHDAGDEDPTTWKELP